MRALWQTWLNEKLTSGGGATTEEVSGLVLPPDDWMNERLTRLGRPYRVRARGSQFDILAVEIKDAGTN